MKKLFRMAFFLVVGLFLGCDSDGDDQENPVAVDMTAAILNDFHLSEVSYTNIQISQPEIMNGTQRTSGEITLTIPATFEGFELSLASVNFDESKFEISPGIGEVQSFIAGNSVTYTITSLENPDSRISYRVSVIKEDPQIEPRITGFRFEKDKNTSLPSDIEALRIVEYPAMDSNAIFILVPVGTDFSDLVPSIDFEGGELYYRQGNLDFSPYPETDPSIDFTSDYDFVSFRDKNELELSVNTSESQKTYRVILEVEAPIELQENSVTTPDVFQGETRIFLYTWVNRGNHPVQHGMSASEFRNVNETDTKANILDASLTIADAMQAGFIRPGEEGNISITVNGDGAIVGDYEVNVLFAPKYDVNRAMINDLEDDLNPIEAIFDPVELQVKTTILNRG